MFSCFDSERSPLMVPGRAASESVAPFRVRTASTARSPSRTIATSGPEVMNARNSGYQGLATCSA